MLYIYSVLYIIAYIFLSTHVSNRKYSNSFNNLLFAFELFKF